MTTRRRFIQISALGAITPVRVLAQARQAKIGMLGPVPLKQSVYSPDIVRRLHELGYRDVEYRSAEGSIELYVKQARELIAAHAAELELEDELADEPFLSFVQPGAEFFGRRMSAGQMLDVDQLHLGIAQAVERIQMILQGTANFLDIAFREKRTEQLDRGQQPAGFDA